jgi:phosphoglycerate-specific signal transduction histidine kinase
MPSDAHALATIRANQTQIIIPELVAIQGLLITLQQSVTAMSKALQQQGTIMAEDFSELNAEVTNLQAEVGKISAQMDTLLADLQAALSAGNQPAIDAAAAALKDQIDALKAIETRDMPPPPPGP